MNTTDEKVRIMCAFMNGEDIQKFSYREECWVDYDDEPIWINRHDEYRIKETLYVRYRRSYKWR